MEVRRKSRARLSRNESADRLAKLGVDVLCGEAKFVSTDTVEGDARRLRFSRGVIATGERAASPPIPRIAEAGFLTNETVFSLTELPKRLVVIGAGPIGCELAQAFRCFGSEVFILSRGPRLLPREDADAAAVLSAQLEREGIRLMLGVKIRKVEKRNEGKVVVFDGQTTHGEVVGDEILVGVGRAPNVEGLNLEAAGVEFDQTGVKVDDRLRTTNRRIYAAGDICSVYKFTHAADAMARIALQNALFFGRKTASAPVIPWSPYTHPNAPHACPYTQH